MLKPIKDFPNEIGEKRLVDGIGILVEFKKKCKSHLKFNLKINISLNEQQFHVANFDLLLSSRKTFV